MVDTTDTKDVLAEEKRLREIQTNVETRHDGLKRRLGELNREIGSAQAAIKAEVQDAAASGREPDVDGHHRKAAEARAELSRVEAERDALDTAAPVEAIRRHRVKHLDVYAELAEESTQAALAAIERARSAYVEAETAWTAANAEWGRIVGDHNRSAPTELKLPHPRPHDWQPARKVLAAPVPRCPAFEPISEGV